MCIRDSNHADRYAAFVQCTQNADMGPAARRAASEGQGHAGAGALLYGHRLEATPEGFVTLEDPSEHSVTM